MSEHAGTIHPYPNFNVEADCQALKKSMKGLGTDEDAIIQILCHRSLDQRLNIKQQYKTFFGKDLVKELKSELSGHFEDVILALLMEPIEYDCVCLRKAMKGAGTNEKWLTEIICSKSNHEIRQIKEKFQQMYGKDLEKEVVSETSGIYRRVLVSLLQGNRPELTQEQVDNVQAHGPDAIVDKVLAEKEAQELFNAGIKKIGTDEEVFFRILLARDPIQLRATFAAYEQIAKEDIFTSISKEMSGDLGHALQVVALSHISQPLLYARILYYAMKGAGTRDDTLIRIIVTRSEIDLQEIKNHFEKATGTTLRKFVEDDTSGDYKKALLAILG